MGYDTMHILKSLLCSICLATSASGSASAVNVVVETDKGNCYEVQLEKTKATQALLASLPLELNLEDFADTERIAYLEKKFSLDEDYSYSPRSGDLAYYEPWGNLAFFKKDFRTSNHLHLIGHVSMQCIKDLTGSKKAIIKYRNEEVQEK